MIVSISKEGVVIGSQEILRKEMENRGKIGKH